VCAWLLPLLWHETHGVAHQFVLYVAPLYDWVSVCHFPKVCFENMNTSVEYWYLSTKSSTVVNDIEYPSRGGLDLPSIDSPSSSHCLHRIQEPPDDNQTPAAIALVETGGSLVRAGCYCLRWRHIDCHRYCGLTRLVLDQRSAHNIELKVVLSMPTVDQSSCRSCVGSLRPWLPWTTKAHPRWLQR